MHALKSLFAELDPVLHERGRLAIVAALATEPSLTFLELREALGMTDGNLSVHLQRLEKGGYLQIDKTPVGKRTTTSCKLTRAGRKAFADYLDCMENLVKAARGE